MARPWSKKEIATLCAIVKSGLKLKEHMHRLPGRTHSGAEWKKANIQARAPTLDMRVRELMSDGVERTAREIADALEMDRKRVSDVLRAAIEPGPLQEMHAVRMTGTRPMRVFAMGPGENVPSDMATRMAARLADPADELSDEELDRKYRSHGTWWPRGDPLVIASINAMVHAGRRAA